MISRNSLATSIFLYKFVLPICRVPAGERSQALLCCFIARRIQKMDRCNKNIQVKACLVNCISKGRGGGGVRVPQMALEGGAKNTNERKRKGERKNSHEFQGLFPPIMKVV